MNDLIYRQAAIEINQSYHGWMPNEVNYRIWKEIKELPATNRWIPCKERLPERGVDVLTYSELVNFIEIQSIEPHFGNDCWENQHGDLQELNTVTAWMPLPEPYKEEEDGTLD